MNLFLIIEKLFFLESYLFNNIKNLLLKKQQKFSELKNLYQEYAQTD